MKPTSAKVSAYFRSRFPIYEIVYTETHLYHNQWRTKLRSRTKELTTEIGFNGAHYYFSVARRDGFNIIESANSLTGIMKKFQDYHLKLS